MYFTVHNHELVVLVSSLISKLVATRLISIIIAYKLKKAGWESWCKLKTERELFVQEMESIFLSQLNQMKK